MLNDGDFSVMLGRLTLDLVSAPIDPGDYRLRLAATMGGGELFLPRCVRLTLDEHAALGGSRLVTGPEHWSWMRARLDGHVAVPPDIPGYALEPYSVRRVSLAITALVAMGGFTIYQL